MSETIVAFARWCLCGTETAIAFAGEKWVFLVRFSSAVVMSVSQLPRGCVLCAKKFALLGLMVGVSAKKFALRTKNGPKLAFSGVLGEFFRGNVAGGALLGEFFADRQLWDPTGRVVLRRGPGHWVLLLAVLTLQCAAKPT